MVLEIILYGMPSDVSNKSKVTAFAFNEKCSLWLCVLYGMHVTKSDLWSDDCKICVSAGSKHDHKWVQSLKKDYLHCFFLFFSYRRTRICTLCLFVSFLIYLFKPFFCEKAQHSADINSWQNFYFLCLHTTLGHFKS